MKVKGLDKDIYEGPMEMDDSVGIDYRSGGQPGWMGRMGGKLGHI